MLEFFNSVSVTMTSCFKKKNQYLHLKMRDTDLDPYKLFTLNCQINSTFMLFVHIYRDQKKNNKNRKTTTMLNS